MPSLKKLDASLASAIFFCSPLLIYIYAIITKKRKISLAGVLAVVLCLTGSLLIINVFKANTLSVSSTGILLGVCACICYAFFNIFTDLKIDNANPFAFNFYTSLMVFTTVSIIVLFLNDSTVFKNPLPIYLIGYIIFVAIITGILPIIFIYKSIKKIGAEKTSIIATTELPLVIVLSLVFLKETMTLTQTIGVILVIIAVIIITRAC